MLCFFKEVGNYDATWLAYRYNGVLNSIYHFLYDKVTIKDRVKVKLKVNVKIKTCRLPEEFG